MAKPDGSFLDMRGWNKGNVWVNGHHLGRFWRIGPQQTLYVPASWLKKGRNDIVVLEMQAGGSHTIAGLKDPVFDTPAK
jgi:beta-galactosidase